MNAMRRRGGGRAITYREKERGKSPGLLPCKEKLQWGSSITKESRGNTRITPKWHLMISSYRSR